MKMGIQEGIVLLLTLFSTFLTVKSDGAESETVDKRAPGWGKRDAADKLGYLEMLTDLSRYEMNKDNEHYGLDKRRPGWGKRSFDDDFDMEKRRPGWGKRSAYDTDSLQVKRAPGWGKRSYIINDDSVEDERLKRRPGWGKRSAFGEYGMEKRRPGWGKRAPGWGKRSQSDNRCMDIMNDVRLLRLKLAQMKEELAMTCPNTMYDDGALYQS